MVSRMTTHADSPVIAFAGGGTGGHLYPALAVAEALRGMVAGVRFLFFGTDRAIDARIIDRDDCELVRQSLPPLTRVPWRWPNVYLGFRRSTLLCRARLANDRPMAVIGTGGLGSVPAVRQAGRAGVTTALLNPDAIPGKANRLLSWTADAVFAQWQETADHLPRRAKVRVTGCPVRWAFTNQDRSTCVASFGLDPGRKTLLVTGASQGARTINDAVLANLDFLAAQSAWQVLHLTGKADYERVAVAYADSPARAVVLDYTDRMADALAAADLVVSRAGASTLAEISASGVASILMPYPFHRDMHQLANARCLARVSAGVIVRDGIDVAVNGPALRGALGPLMSDDRRRVTMADAARRMGRPDAAVHVASEILSLVQQRCGRGRRERVEQRSEVARYEY